MLLALTSNKSIFFMGHNILLLSFWVLSTCLVFRWSAAQCYCWSMHRYVYAWNIVNSLIKIIRKVYGMSKILFQLCCYIWRYSRICSKWLIVYVYFKTICLFTFFFWFYIIVHFDFSNSFKLLKTKIYFAFCLIFSIISKMQHATT